MVPVLETERFILRDHKLADFPIHYAMWSDQRTIRRVGGAKRSEEELWLRFLRNEGQRQLMGSGMWALEERASGAYAGAVGFIYAKQMMEVPFRDAPGWVVAPDFHGKGLARESVAKVLCWGDVHLEAPLTWCMIDPVNVVSRKVAAGAGFKEAKRATYKDIEMLTFVRPRAGI